MAAAFAGRLLHNIYSSYKYAVGHGGNDTTIFIQTRNYAARKGTRARKEAIKRKRKLQKAAQKVEKVPQYVLTKQKKQKNAESSVIKSDDSSKPIPTDNVWVGKYYRWKVYSFEEALQCHREIHHPTMLNMPDAYVNAFIELDLQGSKKTQTVSKFTRIVDIPHRFDHGEERKILAFCKNSEILNELITAGATKAGGKELIKAFQAGEESLKTYEYYLAHPDIMADLLLIKGLMKRKFPSLRAGTLSGDLISAVNKFVNGIRYTAEPHGLQKDYGLITVPIGRLNMDTKHLEENFVAIINDIHSVKPKKENPFITRIRLLSPPSPEKLKIDFAQYLPKEQRDVDGEEEEEDDVRNSVIASN